MKAIKMCWTEKAYFFDLFVNIDLRVVLYLEINLQIRKKKLYNFPIV